MYADTFLAARVYRWSRVQDGAAYRSGRVVNCAVCTHEKQNRRGDGHNDDRNTCDQNERLKTISRRKRYGNGWPGPKTRGVNEVMEKLVEERD